VEDLIEEVNKKYNKYHFESEMKGANIDHPGGCKKM
jgi:hypothetical protein